MRRSRVPLGCDGTGSGAAAPTRAGKPGVEDPQDLVYGLVAESGGGVEKISRMLAGLLEGLADEVGEADEAGGAEVADVDSLQVSQPAESDSPTQSRSPDADSLEDSPSAAVIESDTPVRIASLQSAGAVTPNAARPAYATAALPANASASFYEMRSNRTLSEQLQAVGNVEGPLPESILFRKVARAWGLERLSPRVMDRLRSLVPHTTPRTIEAHETFYWPEHADPATFDGFRIAHGGEESKRHVDDVCREELANLILHVLDEAGSAPRQDVARAVCRLVGMNRMTGEAERRVGRVVEGRRPRAFWLMKVEEFEVGRIGDGLNGVSRAKFEAVSKGEHTRAKYSPHSVSLSADVSTKSLRLPDTFK